MSDDHNAWRGNRYLTPLWMLSSPFWSDSTSGSTSKLIHQIAKLSILSENIIQCFGSSHKSFNFQSWTSVAVVGDVSNVNPWHRKVIASSYPIHDRHFKHSVWNLAKYSTVDTVISLTMIWLVSRLDRGYKNGFQTVYDQNKNRKQNRNQNGLPNRTVIRFIQTLIPMYWVISKRKQNPIKNQSRNQMKCHWTPHQMEMYRIQIHLNPLRKSVKRDESLRFERNPVLINHQITVKFVFWDQTVNYGH